MIRMALAVFATAFIASHAPAAHAASIVTEWLDEALPEADEVAWEPTVGSRFFAIFHTALYDAWAAYDPVAVGVASGTILKGTGGASNEANKREALSHAAYTVLRALAPQRQRALAERMVQLGYDLQATTAPAELGRLAARAVLAVAREDGANEAGNFADTTGYVPRDAGGPAAWRPTAFFGKRQLPTTPQWSRVVPFALSRADQYRPPPPPAPGSAAWSAQIDALIGTSGALTDPQKATAEFWAEWGSSPAPHLVELTKFASDTNDLRLDDDVKLFFTVANALLDASIATWDAKYAYDYARPVTAIRALGAIRIRAWHQQSSPAVLAYSTPRSGAGIDVPEVAPGVGDVSADEWQPYLPTPGFPAYVSGHSVLAAAWARVMELATGRPDLNFRKTVDHLYVEHRHLAVPVTLDYPTFAAAADASGRSRIWGGVHWPADDLQGRELGRAVGETVWQRAQDYVHGTASPAAATFAALRPPFWYHEDEAEDRRAQFRTVGGLAIDLPPGGAACWRSVTIDPLPAGRYQLTLRMSASGEGPLRARIAVETRPAADTASLATAEADLAGGAEPRIVSLQWASDGRQPLAVSIEGRAGSGSGGLLVSAIGATRIWPVAAGSPRYYEPRSAGQ